MSTGSTILKMVPVLVGIIGNVVLVRAVILGHTNTIDIHGFFRVLIFLFLHIKIFHQIEMLT